LKDCKLGNIFVAKGTSLVLISALKIPLKNKMQKILYALAMSLM